MSDKQHLKPSGKSKDSSSRRKEKTEPFQYFSMEPHDQEIFQEHLMALQEFKAQEVLTTELPAVPEAGDQRSPDENKENVHQRIYHDPSPPYDKQMREDQKQAAREDFEDDEDFHSAQFRRRRDWNTRKRLAIENLEQQVELTSGSMELLVYGSPLQILNEVPDYDEPDSMQRYVLAFYLKPESIARDQLFIANGSPVSVSPCLAPMCRNVFEIASVDGDMYGFPVTYKSAIYIKVYYNEENKPFYLSVDISSPYTVGSLFLQNTASEQCQFHILSIMEENNINQELVDIHMPVLLRHVKTGFLVMSQTCTTIFNLCGEEKYVHASDEPDGNNVLWKLAYGLEDETADTWSSNLLQERWWDPNILKEDTCSVISEGPESQPSCSEDPFGPGPSNYPWSKAVQLPIDDQSIPKWVEITPGKKIGTPTESTDSDDEPVQKPLPHGPKFVPIRLTKPSLYKPTQIPPYKPLAKISPITPKPDITKPILPKLVGAMRTKTPDLRQKATDLEIWKQSIERAYESSKSNLDSYNDFAGIRLKVTDDDQKHQTSSILSKFWSLKEANNNLQNKTVKQIKGKMDIKTDQTPSSSENLSQAVCKTRLPRGSPKKPLTGTVASTKLATRKTSKLQLTALKCIDEQIVTLRSKIKDIMNRVSDLDIQDENIYEDEDESSTSTSQSTTDTSTSQETDSESSICKFEWDLNLLDKIQQDIHKSAEISEQDDSDSDTSTIVAAEEIPEDEAVREQDYHFHIPEPVGNVRKPYIIIESNGKLVKAIFGHETNPSDDSK